MRKNFARFVLFTLLFSILSGCFSQPTPSQGVFKKTAAAVTVAAMIRTLAAPYTQTAILRTVVAQFTRAAAASASAPPSTEILPTIPITPGLPLTYGPTVNPALCNWAFFISDVSYPDGSEILPGQSFRKTWRIQNSGTCTWDARYSLTFDRGTQMGAPSYQSLTTSTVPPGGIVDVSVDMIAPSASGSYQAYFRLRGSDGSILSVGNHGDGGLWALIRVGLPQQCNWAALITDVTYPDNTRVDPGQIFNKKWRLQNIGTCTWSPEYALVFMGGDRLGAPDFQQLSRQSVLPSGVVDVGVNLTAPQNFGTYRAIFKIRSARGEIFGVGSDADHPIWAKIIVGPTPTFTPTNTLTPSATATTPPPTPTSSSTVTPSSTATATSTSTLTPSATITPSPTETDTATPSNTPITPSGGGSLHIF